MIDTSMHIIHAIVLGIIEGFTEFLPISSTGHLILAEKLLHLPDTAFIKSFTVFIQLGAILAVSVLYARKLVTSKALLLRVFIAFLPTAFVGLLLYPFIKRVLLGNDAVTAVALFAGGIVLLFIDRMGFVKRETKADIASLSYTDALWIGVFQSVSVVPGVSRAAATIVGGMAVRLNRRDAVMFSFLLAIPTMAAATALDLTKSASSFTGSEFVLLGVGFAASFAVALFVIRFFLQYVARHTFAVFGAYRIAIAAVYWLWAGR
jgi:undecaprenyl-diphosphatase